MEGVFFWKKKKLILYLFPGKKQELVHELYITRCDVVVHVLLFRQDFDNQNIITLSPSQRSLCFYAKSELYNKAKMFALIMIDDINC